MLNSRRKSPERDDSEDEAKQPPKRKSSFGLKKDPLTQTGITSFFNAKEGGGGAAFKSALELSTKDSEQGRDSTRNVVLL